MARRNQISVTRDRGADFDPHWEKTAMMQSASFGDFDMSKKVNVQAIRTVRLTKLTC